MPACPGAHSCRWRFSKTIWWRRKPRKAEAQWVTSKRWARRRDFHPTFSRGTIKQVVSALPSKLRFLGTEKRIRSPSSATVGKLFLGETDGPAQRQSREARAASGHRRPRHPAVPEEKRPRKGSLRTASARQSAKGEIKPRSSGRLNLHIPLYNIGRCHRSPSAWSPFTAPNPTIDISSAKRGWARTEIAIPWIPTRSV